MLGGSMDLYGQMPSAYDWASFEFLAHENYSSWQIFMHKLLYSYGQEHLDIVLGKHTRLDAEDKHKFDAVDEIALSTIRLAIDKEIHPWVLDVFSSSKELWDSLQFKFEIDAVMATMIADTDVHQEDIPYTFPHDDYKIVENLGEAQAARIKHEHTMSNEDNVHDISPSSMIQTLPVPVIHDDQCITSSLANEIVEECLPLSIEQSNIFFLVNDNMNLLKGYDVLHLSQDFQLYEGEYDRQYQMFGLDELDSCHVVENASHDIIQQLQVPFIDDYLEVAALSSIVQSFMSKASEYVVPELIFECTSSKGSYESVYQKSDWSPLGNDPLLHDSFVIWDEVFEHQVYTADYKDEFILELPWMDTPEQTAGFTSIITKVSKHEVDFPLYIHLHIPFVCTHDGKVEDHSNLDDCLGYISYPGIGGLTNRLKVNYRCLHMRNQVLITLDIYDHTSLSTESLPQQFGVDQSESSNNNSLDLYDTDMIGRLSDVICEFYHSTESDFLRKVYALQKIYIVDMGYQSHAGSYISSMNVYITKTREWYRGRKIWFKTKFQWHPWLLMWLSLLYMLNFRTCNISGGMLVLGFIVLFLFSHARHQGGC